MIATFTSRRWDLPCWWRSRGDKDCEAGVTSRLRPGRVFAGTAAACLLMGVATVRQSLYWSDDLSLNFHAHQIAPHNVSATTSLGRSRGPTWNAWTGDRSVPASVGGPTQLLAGQCQPGLPRLWAGKLSGVGAGYFARACAADPTDGDQFLYLGIALLRMGQLAEAEKAVRTARRSPAGKELPLGPGDGAEGRGETLRGKGRDHRRTCQGSSERAGQKPDG